jgi:signal peptidase I
MTRSRLFHALERAFAVFGLLMFVYHTGFDVSVISSHSMSPTLQGESFMQGDVVLTEKLSLMLRKPRRWEVVKFINEEFGSPVMKRVIGLPGETVSLRTKPQTVFINGTAVARPSSLNGITYLAYGNLSNGASVKCGDGYFVLGDLSMDSEDSRWTGPIRPQVLRGRAWLVVWPPRRAGFVNP